MKGFLPAFRNAMGVAPRRASARQRSFPADSRTTAGYPQPGEVLGEVGLILAVHLAVAVAVTLTLRAFGIA
jgi:hypothetical protein